MNAKTEIIKAYESSSLINGFVKIYDILTDTDIPTDEFVEALKVLENEGWYIIPNSQGGDVTPEERKYCPIIGFAQVHLIARSI